MKKKKNLINLKKLRENIITSLKHLLTFCFDEVTVFLLFVTMVLFTVTTKSHINLIVNLENTKLGFPMFGFVFMSIINFLASLAFMKKRSFLSSFVILLVSAVVIYFVCYYIKLVINDKYYYGNEYVFVSFLVVISGTLLTVLAIILGVIFSFISGKCDQTKKIFKKDSK